GQTYKWQQSVTGNAPWSDVDTAKSSPSQSTSQLVSTYYRCAVTCGGNTVYSDSLQVLSPLAINGSFTINSALPTGSGNFATFTDALDYIKCGINGPVVFDIAPGSGPYILSNTLEIPIINGASSTNTVTIKGNGETISYNSTNTNERAAILLNGADYIILDSLNIDVSAGTYGFGIHLMNNADHNIIRNCTILNNTSATSTNYAGIVMSNSLTTATTAGDNGSNNLIENNRIVGGYYGITIVGSTPALAENNIVRNNSVEDFYFYGIYTIYQNNNRVQNNEIHRPLRSTVSTFYGIYLTTGNEGSVIDGNRIHNGFTGATTSTSAFYGIYVSSDGTAVSPNKLINNLIYNNEGNGTHYGIYNTSGEYMQAYHNTIALDYTAATAGTTYGFYQVTTAPGIEFKNNIVYITRGGSGAKYCIYKSTATTPIESNHNVFYLGSAGSGAQNIGYQTSAQATLGNWQTTSSQDANSVVADPLFANPGSGDYLFTELNINNLGTPVGVLTDINGSPRNPSAPDPGAYEFVAPPCIAPPTAGNATSNKLNVCIGEDFSLNLSGNSTGSGQTYKWQQSVTGNAPWVDVDTAIATPSYTTSQLVSTYYRCAVTCGG
ncbi:MAG: right-handed parallel beta-helix repeat-containing protein, partial [Chitinophagaceae bacterium]|nr:right-handed parallel beta-helix repeat-containing protein [Chitinophagaceae bacterium]